MSVRDVANRLRLSAALSGARVTSQATRVARRGGGTALPGLVAVRIDPQFVSKVVRSLPQGVVVVAGTNGKTTTSRLIASILSDSGLRVAHNRSGSNLLRGVAAALANQTSVRGLLDADIAVIEADEAAMPEIVAQTQPRLVILTNLFRDQLDRYGELNAIAAKWEPALAMLEPSAAVVVNADDPRLVDISRATSAHVEYFSVDPGAYALESMPHAADVAVCSECGADLRYHALTVSHLGSWYCPQCGHERPASTVVATKVRLDGIEAIETTLRVGESSNVAMRVSIPGLYTVYNVAAAATAAFALGIEPVRVARTAEQFRTPFGRLEQFTIEGRRVTLALVKNPVAFNETLRMIAGGADGLMVPAMIAINDLDADGRDVSWLWDVDFEMLARGVAPVSATGIRGADMANRLKYAGVSMQRISLRSPELRTSLYDFVRSLEPGGKGFVLATYTAMLGLRQVAVDDGFAQAYWEE